MSSTYPSNEPDEIVAVDINREIELTVPDGYPAVVEVATFGSRDDLLELLVVQPMPGPKGVDGTAAPAEGYEHIQSAASAVWTIPHNLGRRPIVAVTTTGGVQVLGGEILHLNANTLTITFDVAFTGIARCI